MFCVYINHKTRRVYFAGWPHKPWNYRGNKILQTPTRKVAARLTISFSTLLNYELYMTGDLLDPYSDV